MRSMVSAPFRLILYTVLVMNVSGGGSSDESDEDDEPVDYYTSATSSPSVPPSLAKLLPSTTFYSIPVLEISRSTTTSSTSASTAPTSGIGFTVTSSSVRLHRRQRASTLFVPPLDGRLKTSARRLLCSDLYCTQPYRIRVLRLLTMPPLHSPPHPGAPRARAPYFRQPLSSSPPLQPFPLSLALPYHHVKFP